MNFIDRFFIRHPKVYNWLRVLLPNIILIIFAICVMCGCSTIKEVPVQTVEKVVVRDSVVYVKDTVEIPIPYEVIKEIVPQDTVSILKTSVASSEAKIEKGMLHHKLEQKGTVKTQIDTFYVTQIKEVEKLVEVPIEVVKEVKHIPVFFWWSLVFNIVIVLIWVFRIYLKSKGL